MPRRTIRFDNTYADGDESSNEQFVKLRDRRPGETDDEWDAYLGDALFEFTGSGRTDDIGSYYEATSVDGLEPAIYYEWSD